MVFAGATIEDELLQKGGVLRFVMEGEQAIAEGSGLGGFNREAVGKEGGGETGGEGKLKQEELAMKEKRLSEQEEIIASLRQELAHSHALADELVKKHVLPFGGGGGGGAGVEEHKRLGFVESFFAINPSSFSSSSSSLDAAQDAPPPPYSYTYVFVLAGVLLCALLSARALEAIGVLKAFQRATGGASGISFSPFLSSRSKSPSYTV